MGITRVYHGNHESIPAIHLGLCLTDDNDAARDYGRPGYMSDGWVHEMELDLTGLTVIVTDGYDHDENTAPGDDGDTCGADVLIFSDETDTGRRHKTWRLMTPAALVACTLIATATAECS